MAHVPFQTIGDETLSTSTTTFPSSLVLDLLNLSFLSFKIHFEAVDRLGQILANADLIDTYIIRLPVTTVCSIQDAQRFRTVREQSYVSASSSIILI